MTTYKDSGVDIDAADDAKQRMKESIDTGDSRVLNTLGAFASLVEGSFAGYDDPVLALKTEEPGSKQMLAFQHGHHRSICFDTINHLINDIIVMGATPLYVQDAIICGKLEPAVVTALVEAFAAACKEQGCALVGGETSEQPGMLEAGKYILTASIVGVVERAKIIDGSTIAPGDAVLAVASNGLHTNGYTLVRKLLADDPQLADSPVDDTTFLEAIMLPHRCYYQAVRDLFTHAGVHGLAHITGGGIEGNLKRIVPETCEAQVDVSALQIPSVFKVIQKAGQVPDADMLRTYNLGAGLVMVLAPDAVAEVQEHLHKHDMDSNVIGAIADGNGVVQLAGDLHM